MSDVLYEALQARGIPYPKEEVALNKFTRWGKNSRYWAVRFEGGYSFGDFARSERWETFEKNYDREKCKNEIRAVQKKLNEEKKYEQAKAAIAAQREWSAAQNCESHPYLEKKRIRSHGLKIENDALLIPLFDENDNLVSLQKIFFDEREGKFVKKFHKGSRTKGCYFVLGEIREELVICEGYATEASIYECVEKPVVVAFSSGGLCDVAKTMRKKYPAAKITIAADNDQFNEGGYNPGLTKAKG